MKEILLVSTPAESEFHKVIKLLLYRNLHENDNLITEGSIEKHFRNRIADLYFKLQTGEEIVVEVQNSMITVKEIIKRTKDYNKRGIFVLWILYGEGNCVASLKYPKNVKNSKVSLAENYLHRMYGGRVYYVNLKLQKDRGTLTTPFALHFSKVLKKSRRRLFKIGYKSFFYRNCNYSIIPSWKLLCTEFSGFKIARFYDKNKKNILKDRIITYYLLRKNVLKNGKKLIKSITKQFKKEFGKYMILNAIIELTNEKRVEISFKLIRKIHKNLLD